MSNLGRVRFIVVASAIALAAMATPARADGLVTPFVGANFGGDSHNGQLDYGIAFGFMGAGIFGLEGEFSYSPDFFDLHDRLVLADDSNVTSLMLNMLLGAPIGGQTGPGVRPYATVGAGLLRSRVTGANALFDDLSRNDFGVNVGAGIMGFFSDRVGLRGDVRYFRSLTGDNDDAALGLGTFHFLRAYGGVVIRF